ncbi:MAG: SMP-30/gluconolactonase/LRE family protein [Puniceicoccaceae bacterium]|nr:MAG: SMP-30/gluconolactonase/LRE family protein [Puniceicoccaceae bacterium]
MKIEAELVVDAQCLLGEGPLWEPREGRLYWVDILNRRIHWYEPGSGATGHFMLSGMPGSLHRSPETGRLIAASTDGILSVDTKTGAAEVLGTPVDLGENRRPNDGKTDPRGRIFTGVMGMKGERGIGGLYRLDRPEGPAVTLLEKLSTPNGLTWNAAADTFHHIDTPRRTVLEYDYDPATGAIEERRTALDFSGGQGGPDGMTIDASDRLWVAFWGGYSVRHYDPRSGEVLGEIALPCGQVTSCAFGGPELDELYITSARVGRSAKEPGFEPEAGGLFRCRPGVRGVPEPMVGRGRE